MAILRSFIRTLAFLTSVIGLGLVFLPTLLFDRPALQHWRLKIFSKWAKQILRVFGIQIHSENPYGDIESIPRVIIANHVSYLDIPVIASLGPSLFLAKSEVAAWPLVGQVSRSLGMLFVKRARLRDRAQTIERIRDKLQQGFSVTIFPEGTTSDTGPQRGRVPYFAGAFRAAREAGLSVEMIYLEYSPLENAAWLGDAPFAGHLWKLLGGPPIQVRIRRQILPALKNRDHQVQSYFWSRGWMLEGGRDMFSSGRLVYGSPVLSYQNYRRRAQTTDFSGLKDTDTAYRPSNGPEQF